MFAGFALPVLTCLTATLLAAESPLRIIDGRPVVDGVFVNGHGPYRFLIDTATTMNHIEPDLAARIGLEPTFRTQLISSVGATMAKGINGVEVTLGEAHAPNQQFLFAGMEVVHQLAGDIQGILGQSFLSHFDYRVDLAKRRLAFGPHEAAGKRAKFRVQDGRHVIATSLGELILDSGAAHVILFGVSPSSNAFSDLRTMAGSKLVGTTYSKLLIAGQRIWSGHAVAIPNRREDGIAGLMPLNVFRAVYVCNSDGYLAFEN